MSAYPVTGHVDGRTDGSWILMHHPLGSGALQLVGFTTGAGE